jgi:hypothetical protein
MRFWVGVFLLLILPISFVTGCDKNDGWDKLLEADDAFFVYSFYDLWDGGYTSLKSNIRLEPKNLCLSASSNTPLPS